MVRILVSAPMSDEQNHILETETENECAREELIEAIEITKAKIEQKLAILMQHNCIPESFKNLIHERTR